MMKQCFNCILVLTLFLTSFYYKSYAQNIRVEAKLDKTSILLGDQTRLHLSIRFPAKEHITFPVLKDTITGKIQIVGNSKADTTFENDLSTEIIKRSFTITSFDAGTYVIPPFEFQTKSGVYKSEALSLQILSVTVDTSKSIYDIKQPMAVSYTFFDWLRDNWRWAVFPLLAVLLIIWIIYYIRKMPKKEHPVKEVKADIPAHAIALGKLYDLRDKKLWQNNQVKQYHSELSDVIREYLEKKYAIKAQEQTTAEILASLKYMEIAEENRSKLRQMLILADLVKFAKEKPFSADNERSMENAIDFVTKTQPVIQKSDNTEESLNNELV